MATSDREKIRQAVEDGRMSIDDAAKALGGIAKHAAKIVKKGK